MFIANISASETEMSLRLYKGVFNKLTEEYLYIHPTWYHTEFCCEKMCKDLQKDMNTLLSGKWRIKHRWSLELIKEIEIMEVFTSKTLETWRDEILSKCKKNNSLIRIKTYERTAEHSFVGKIVEIEDNFVKLNLYHKVLNYHPTSAIEKIQVNNISHVKVQE